MNIIVTGASGFIGKALCKELLKKKHIVYTLSRSPLPLEISKLGFVKHINTSWVICFQKRFLKLMQS